MIQDRIIKEDNKNIFIPIDIGNKGDKPVSTFWNTKKSGTVVGMLILVFFGIIIGCNVGILGIIVCEVIVLIINIIIVRRIILEEKYIKAVYKRFDENKDRTSGIFWGISFFKEKLNGGTVANYVNGKIGCFVKLDRGSIIGQEREFEEKHYDVISDFYKEVNEKEYKTVWINTMEESSKDDRLEKLTKFIKKEKNPRIREMLELDLSLMKKKAENNFYEEDRVLIYDDNNIRLENIEEDTVEMASGLLNGSFIQMHIESEEEIMGLHKVINSINYFDITNAKEDMHEYTKRENPILIEKLEFEDGQTLILDENGNKVLYKILERYKNGEKDIDILKEMLKNVGNQKSKNERVDIVIDEDKVVNKGENIEKKEENYEEVEIEI